MKERIKNPILLAALAGLLYQLANWVSTKFFGQPIDPKVWMDAFNVVSYLLIGVGIFATWPNNTNLQNAQIAPVPVESAPPVIAPVVSQVESVSPPTIAPEVILDSSEEVTATTEQP